MRWGTTRLRGERAQAGAVMLRFAACANGPRKPPY